MCSVIKRALEYPPGKKYLLIGLNGNLSNRSKKQKVGKIKYMPLTSLVETAIRF